MSGADFLVRARRPDRGRRGRHRLAANKIVLRDDFSMLREMFNDTPQEDVRVALQRSHALLSDTGQLFDALDARSNFEPIMQSVRDLNKLDDG
jgi:hypothetical protein